MPREHFKRAADRGGISAVLILQNQEAKWGFYQNFKEAISGRQKFAMEFLWTAPNWGVLGKSSVIPDRCQQ